MENVKLSPPWITFYKEICAMFSQDEDIRIEYNEDKSAITLLVKKYEKAEALKRIMPKEKAFGNVVVKINIEYRNGIQTVEEAYKLAFENNPAFKYTFVFQADTNAITYVVFKKEVVQYWNDDMSDPHGVTSTLYENIADDIFEKENGVIFSTDSDKNNGWMKKYFSAHATPDEVEECEYYNGEGSFSDGSRLPKGEEPIKVKNEKTFRSIFNHEKADDYPF